MQNQTVALVARVTQAITPNSRMFSGVVPAALILAIVGCGQSEKSLKNAETGTPMDLAPASLVLTNGKIATVDDALGTQESIAVTGHIITAVGSNEDIAPYIGPETTVLNVQGKLVIPGFIEGHGHYMSLGRARQILDLSTAKNWGY